MAEFRTAENILRMIRSNVEYTDSEAKLLDICLTLHTLHDGGNNPTFATHPISSSGTDAYSGISAAARLSGWCAHRLERIISGKKLLKPVYNFVQPHLDYVLLDIRK